MIISVSRRTDIPAFYSDWFINRIREKYCCVVNPFNSNQVSHVSLLPEDVDIIVFWTKNGKPLIKHLPELDDQGYKYYFQYTINGYPKEIEPKLPLLEKSIETFQHLSGKIGPEKVIWRYDPIILSSLTSGYYHLDKFQQIASALEGSTKRVVISIVDEYRAAKGRLKKLDIGYNIHNPSESAFEHLMQGIARIAGEAGMGVFSCAEEIDLDKYGISHGKCIDNAYISKVFGIDVTKKKDKTQRPECGCVLSKDIGSYDTCLHACNYCYANRSIQTVKANYSKHDKESPSLIGHYDCQPKEKSNGQQLSFLKGGFDVKE